MTKGNPPGRMTERERSEWLDLLVCPACKGKLRIVVGVAFSPPAEEWLACEHCRKAYPVRDGIPVMLVEEAETLEGPS